MLKGRFAVLLQARQWPNAYIVPQHESTGPRSNGSAPVPPRDMPSLRVRRSCPPSRLSRLLALAQEASFTQAGGARPRLRHPLRSGTERLFRLCWSTPLVSTTLRDGVCFSGRGGHVDDLHISVCAVQARRS